MKILITGGAGFIGSHLAERCLEEGWEVSILDDFSTGCFENIVPLRQHTSFCYSVDSVLNEPLVSKLMDGTDLVFHLAATVGIRLVVKNPIRTIQTNVHGTEIVLRAAARSKARVLIASSSEVY